MFLWPWGMIARSRRMPKTLRTKTRSSGIPASRGNSTGRVLTPRSGYSKAWVSRSKSIAASISAGSTWSNSSWPLACHCTGVIRCPLRSRLISLRSRTQKPAAGLTGPASTSRVKSVSSSEYEATVPRRDWMSSLRFMGRSPDLYHKARRPPENHDSPGGLPDVFRKMAEDETAGPWGPAAGGSAVGRFPLFHDRTVLGLAQEEGADDHGEDGDDHRVPEAVVDVAGLRHHGGGEERQHAAEPAVADVVGEGHRGVADPRREELHQEGGDRTVDHGDVDHHDQQDE